MDKYSNGFKANPGSVHFLVGPFVARLMKIMGSSIKSSKDEGLLGVRIDSGLTFKEYLTSICSKANQKRDALTRISKYMSYKSAAF